MAALHFGLPKSTTDGYHSIWKNDETKELHNPLVAVLGIGEYNSNPNLGGVVHDCNDARYVFNSLRGFDMVHMNKAGTKVHMTYPTRSPQNNFKLFWTKDDITAFIREVRNMFLTEFSKNYDSLIFIITSHGSEHSVIFDSTGEEIELSNIFKVFDNDNCIALQHKPKIFIIDACRGPLVANYQSIEKKKESGKSKDKKDIVAMKERLLKPVMDSIALTMEQLQTQLNDSTGSGVDSIGGIASENGATAVSNKPIVDHLTFSQSNLRRLTAQSDFYFIYGSVDDFTTVEGDGKGGYLIRSLLKVFANDEYFTKFALRELVQYARYIKNELIGKVNTQVFEEVRRTGYAIKFKAAKFSSARYSVVAIKNNDLKQIKHKMSMAEAASMIFSYASTNSIVKINNTNDGVTTVVNEELSDAIETILTADVIDEKESKVMESMYRLDDKTIVLERYSSRTSVVVINDEHLGDSGKDSIFCIKDCYKTKFELATSCEKVALVSSTYSDITIGSTSTLEKIEFKECSNCWVVVNGKVSLITLTDCGPIGVLFDESVYDKELFPQIVIERCKIPIIVLMGRKKHTLGVSANGSFVYAFNYQTHEWER